MGLGSLRRGAALLGVAWMLSVSQASAAGVPPFELDPTLSLTGDCSTSEFDPIPDPDCPYPSPPEGPVGRFKEPRAITIDAFGNEYVSSYAGSSAEGRIDVFDDEGGFITEVAAPNAKSIAVDSKGNLYVFESSGKIVRYPPSKYEAEAGSIEYAKPPITVATGIFVGAVVIDSGAGHLDQLLVTRPKTIIRYKSAEDGNEVLESVEPVGLGSWPEAIAIDSQRRRIYTSYCENEGSECGVMAVEADAPYNVLKKINSAFDPSSKFVSPFGRFGIAVDEETGDLFIGDIISAKVVYQFNEDYEPVSELKNNEFSANIAVQIAVSNGSRSLAAESCKYPDPEVKEVLAGDACNRHYLFVPVLKSNGRVAAFHPPGQIPPVIEGVATGGIGETEAELTATIFPGGLPTEYSFQITTLEAWEAENEKFKDAATLPGGSIPADSLATEVKAFATGLLPGETYRFRVTAENELGKAEEEGQNEATFTTYEDALVSSSCPNEVLRVGLSARLPDCRAYELVTPSDTSGRPPKGVGFVGNLFTTVEASPAGDAVWFKIEGGSLSGSEGVGSFEGDPYVATRGGSGWSSELAGVSGEEATVSIPGSSSPDQGYAFWTARLEGPLVINGEETQYLRYPDGHSELIGRGNEGQTDPKAEGRLITEDATHVVFETINRAPKAAIQLDPDAPPSGTTAVYDRSVVPVTGAELTRVVSLLPGDETPEAGEDAKYVGASKDGEGIAFSIGSTLYLRVGNETTYEVGEGVEFAGVSEGGERIFYVEGGDLFALDTTGGPPGVKVEFSDTNNVIPVNVAAGGARAYFVSPSVLGGANPEGDSAQPDAQNLYLSEEGAISFVATVTDRDVEGEVPPFQTTPTDGLGLWTEQVSDQLARDPSRTNPDGSVLLFQSRAEITGYEESEFPQIYRYDSDAGRLHCISCIPTGVPATGDGAALQTITFDSLAPPPLGPNGFVNNLAPDGDRVFFESTEALVSTDTDEVKDVYEWEEEDVGSCDRAGGCVYLISSGQSERDNFLYAHSQSGDDVFITTEDALTDADTGGAASIYDAKVDGGFSGSTKPDPCIADGCRPTVTPPPSFPVPVAGGEGNVRSQPKKPRTCPKGKRKVKKHGKVRCVKKKHQAKGGKGKQRTSAKRGTGR